jgi:hypothetical protein
MVIQGPKLKGSREANDSTRHLFAAGLERPLRLLRRAGGVPQDHHQLVQVLLAPFS